LLEIAQQVIFRTTWACNNGQHHATQPDMHGSAGHLSGAEAGSGPLRTMDLQMMLSQTEVAGQDLATQMFS
jgi:hypothetical protein